jgi:hypothetical protein
MDSRTWWVRQINENRLRSDIIPTIGDVDFSLEPWPDFEEWVCIREQLWGIREGLA